MIVYSIPYLAKIMSRITQYSAANLIPEAGVDAGKWNRTPSPDVVGQTIRALQGHGITVNPVANGDEAMAEIQKLIPRGAEVMTGSSTTLIEIGFEDFLAGKTAGWKDLHEVITAENNDVKRAELRRKSVTADYFVSSASAITETGEIYGCDASGSRVGAWPFAAGHVVIISGINKIVPNVEDAMRRVREYVYPLENARAHHAYGTPSMIGKCVILAHEKIPGRVTVILIRDSLGY
jgi:hypothetical protein